MSGSKVNTHRKYNPDPPVKIGINIPESVLRKVDWIRLHRTRTDFIMEAINEAIRRDADEHVKSMKAKINP